MEKPVSFTLRRFLQTNPFEKEQNTYSANWSLQKQCTFDTSSDETLPNKKYYSSRETKRRKTNFPSSDEDFQCFKSAQSPPKKACLAPRSHKSAAEASFSQLYKKHKYKPSTNGTRRGSPKSVVSKRPRPETYKHAGKNRDTKRLNDFLEQHSQYINENRLFKALNIPKKYCKSNESPDSTLHLNASSIFSRKSSSKSFAEQKIAPNTERTLSTNTTDLNVTSSSEGFNSSLKGSFEVRSSRHQPSKTPKLDEFLKSFSQKNKVASTRNTLMRDNNNVSSSFASSEKSEVKESRLIFPLKVGGSQKTVLSFFRKSKKYDKQEVRNGAAPVHEQTEVFMDKENCKVWRKKAATKPEGTLLLNDRMKGIWEEHERKLERVAGGKRRKLIKKRSGSDTSDDSIIRKSYSRKPFRSINTKPIRDRITKKSPLRSLRTRSSADIFIGPKIVRKIYEEGNKESRFLVGKSSKELSRERSQKYLTDRDCFSKELQTNFQDNIWDAPGNVFQTSNINLRPFKNVKATDKGQKHKRFLLRKFSSESNLSENKPIPKLTFGKQVDVPRNQFRSVENVRENSEENPRFKYLNLRGNKGCEKEEEKCLKNTKETQKMATSNFEIMLRHMSKYIEYTSGNHFAQEKKTESIGQSLVETSATLPTKSQKNLLSSEGFHESMSTENIVRKPEPNTLERDIWTNNKENFVSKGSGSITENIQARKQDIIENIKLKALNDSSTSAKLSNVIIQRSSLALHNKKTSKDSSSDPLSLGSPPVRFSPNELPISCQYGIPVNSRVQVQKIVTLQKPDRCQNNSLTPNAQQKKEKFDSQALKDLCRILERNKWEPNCSIQRGTHSAEKDSNEGGVIGKNCNAQYNNGQDKFPKSGPNGNLQPSSENFNQQSDNANNSQLPKASISSTVSQIVTVDLDDNQQQQTQTNEDDAYLLLGEQDACHTQDNYKGSSNLLTGQAQNFSQQESATKNKSNKRRTSYDIPEDCILFGDHLLKELLEERPKIVEAYNKNKAKIKSRKEADDILAKTYIKRYKKGKTKIFKIKRRLKVEQDVIYRAPEDHIIDRFTERLNNDFKDKSSSEREDADSVSTPSSYVSVSDETKSEPLSTGSRKLPKHQMLLRQAINKLSKNSNLLFSRYSDSAPKDFDSTSTLNRIYQIILGILDDYEQDRDPCLKFPKNDLRNYTFRDDRYQMADMVDYTAVGHKGNQRRKRFNLLLFILNKIRILLETDTKLTKRELYYQLKTMIHFQSITDNAIRDISRILNVGVWALNLTAQKGLVYGNLKLTMCNGETINCNVAGTNIPKDVMDICEIQSDAYFILVVEKESVFHKLLEEDLPRRLTRPFIMITGKGFPDLNTQLFLKKLWMVMAIPVLILVDADPHGIAIMLNYRFGSMANAHVSEHLAIPKARWIGVFPSEINKLALSFEILTKTEITKTQQLLKLQCVQENERIKEELQTLLDTETKAGIESVMKTETYLSHRYLSTKFYVNDLI